MPANKTYFVILRPIKLQLTKSTKLNVYKILITPTVEYAAGTLNLI